jgi:uncharacterized protein YbjT (DUF2867 family)
LVEECVAQTGGRSALILGATGLVGNHCLDLLLKDPRYSSVRVIGRRPLGISDPKLKERVVDLDRMEAEVDLFAVDHVFCCLGTTIRKAGSQEAFSRVDVEYPTRAAGLSAKAGARSFLVVSALGADARSRIFYNRAKGQMEEQVRRAAGGVVWILRPSLLVGDRPEPRTGELVGEAVLRIIKPVMVGSLRRYRSIRAVDVARAMIALANSSGSGGIVESDEIVTASGLDDRSQT